MRRATPGDIPQLVQVLARASVDDPFYDWLLPGGARRDRALVDFFTLILSRMSGELADTYVTVDQAGIALWLAPGQHALSLAQLARLAPDFVKVLGWGGIGRGLRVMRHMDRLHERYAPRRHFYLSVLAVAPGRQGNGLGGELLRPVLELCDAQGIGAYLETARARNVSFYERQGFELRCREDHPEFPTFWCFAREPRPG